MKEGINPEFITHCELLGKIFNMCADEVDGLLHELSYSNKSNFLVNIGKEVELNLENWSPENQERIKAAAVYIKDTYKNYYK